jgi:hypothetical protein
MAYSSQDTSNSYSQYNNISMAIQPQQGQPREKIQQVSIYKVMKVMSDKTLKF